MSFELQKRGALEYLTAGALDGTVHCFSTRLGGVSEGYLSSLNLGIHRGDRPANVLENYRILSQAVGFSIHDLVFPRQVHSDIVARVGRADRGQGLFFPVEPERDGLITNEPGVALVAFTADCTPILLYDPVRQAIGAVHAGWRGTAAGIVKNAVAQMVQAFGSRPEDIRAAIGPCISRCCFETDADVPEAMIQHLGPEAGTAIARRGEKYHVDLKALNQLWLRRAGVREIDISEDCTCCQPERFWTHRKVGGRRGSLAAIIMLKNSERKDDLP